MYRAVQLSRIKLSRLEACWYLPQRFFEEAAIPLFVLSVLLAMTVHILAYERGRDQARWTLPSPLRASFILAGLGHLLDLRQLPQGGWWLMIVLPIVWGGYSAYAIGSVYGKHKMTPFSAQRKAGRGTLPGCLHPWLLERFFLCVFIAGTSAFGWVDQSAARAFLGLVIGGLATLGDLGKHVQTSGRT